MQGNIDRKLDFVPSPEMAKKTSDKPLKIEDSFEGTLKKLMHPISREEQKNKFRAMFSAMLVEHDRKLWNKWDKLVNFDEDPKVPMPLIQNKILSDFDDDLQMKYRLLLSKYREGTL